MIEVLAVIGTLTCVYGVYKLLLFAINDHHQKITPVKTVRTKTKSTKPKRTFFKKKYVANPYADLKPKYNDCINAMWDEVNN